MRSGRRDRDSRRPCQRPAIPAFLALWLLALPLSTQTLDEAIDLHAAGSLEAAVRAYRDVAAAPQTPPEDAAMARNNACVALNDLGDYRAALVECREALRLYPMVDDEPGLARTLNNTGLALQYLGRLEEAETQFQRALDLNREHGDAEGQVINLSNLGLAATAAGRYNRALTLHRAAAGLAGRNLSEPWAPGQVRVARINEGVVLEKLGAYREALDVYRLALQEESELDPRSRASLRVNVGVVYRNLGDPVRAREAFEEAIRIYEAAGDTAGLSNAWLNVALVDHLNLRQPAKARHAYGEALRFAEQSGDRAEEIQDLFYLGRLLLEQGLLGDAERAFRRCLAAAERSGSAEGRWSALDGLGRIAAAQGDTRRALDHLQRAMDEIERVRASLRRNTLRSHFFGEKRPVYAAAVEILAKLEAREPGRGHAERALEIAQRAKVRELLDALAGSPQTRAPLRAAELRQRLGDGVLLEYFLGETNLFLWVVRQDGIRMADLGPAAPLLRDAAEVHGRLARGSGPEPVVLSLLSRSLLRPAVPLPGSGSGNLSIAPDGALRYLPFELLPDPDEPERMLVDRHAVSYLPSGSVLAWLDRERADPAVVLLGFGAPEIPKTGILVAGWNLPPLPAAARELGALRKLFPGDAVLKTGGEATEAAFRRSVRKGARVVHLATHTVVDERPGRGAAVLLTPEGDDDGLLYPEEIAALDYQADLSVLAACRSAVTPESGGNALASLTGAFLAAGSPAVLATLWDVGDETTAVFMQQLYYELGRGHAPAEALSLAKRKLREDERWNRPELWAAYVLIGDGPPVAPSCGLPRWLGYAALLAATGLLATLAARKRSSPSQAGS